MDMTPAQKVSRAKAMLVLEQPFVAAIICGMSLIENPALSPPTLATDGKHVWYHPDWVAQQSLDQVMWGLAHETYHNVFQHALRRDGRDPVLWNVAGDYVINALLETDMPRKRPPNVLFDLALYDKGGRTSEGIYALLMEEAEKNGGQGRAQWDNVSDHGGTQSEQSEASAQWKVKIAQAAAGAKMRGKMNADLERIIGDLLQPMVPWEEVLRQFMLKRAKTDYSYARPSRRHLHSGDYLPGKSGVGMGEVWVAVDQSGSVSADELTRFNTELQAIVTDGRPSKTHVSHFHSVVERYDVFEQGEDVVLHKTPSGGTAFSPIFSHILDQGVEPVCCVVLTDLYSSDFGDPPPFPVLWVSTGSLKAPWGQVINMRPKGAV